MRRYAVKLGEVQLQSDKPITADEHRRGIRALLQANHSVSVAPEGGGEDLKTAVHVRRYG